MVSTKMAKTIVVEVTAQEPHPLYRRIIRAQEILCARREERSPRGRRGAHRGDPAADQAEALALKEIVRSGAGAGSGGGCRNRQLVAALRANRETELWL